MRIVAGVLVLCLLVAAGCANSEKMNSLSIGMTKGEVIQVMGRPSSTASPQRGVEVLRYELSSTGDQAWYGITDTYYVKLVNGRIESYGMLGDFDSGRDLAVDVNFRQDP